MAGGFSIDSSKINLFKDFLFNKYKKFNEIIPKQKSLFIDSIIAPSAVNLDFYEKVELLSPFGSGNPEPKFVMENLKAVNNKIVGKKHIKSVLVGPEGSNIKTITFNATENELGAYLLTKKSNAFNIAGKLSLNELLILQR